ncbi:NADH:flavin oxidoreductase [Bacillus thuringiensis]|uniref:NADH-dependent flavin oxidoreductase n=1 Tax=Bacillus thuringiensis HD-771 TaxID=1218175 RepID=A0A9W3JJI7_BACTU|nr:NADH:flavin oxidoreductase [Bacillus thuringiensis]AFQ19763.1 NADH-dependent flavin oxidoreductase [Bacillus thuringiensis HD-771]MEC3268000.1 NADH:flavin oxidoreductase [Bacillus thuringiensis]MEC3515750.1 NADH:flavin oxidoreductase [Bacillus thuringiensis]MED2072805.1 NADH:flavin oxidoreductase [Bacillus thuringiensis]MED2223794.1 NADH:flavin oxidoreductase [Bacillus thuringiensis]
MNTNILFDSVSINKTVLNNRVGVAPMTRISATEEGYITDKMVKYYRSFAKGGFGLIITEGTYIDDKNSQTYFYQPGIAFDEQAQEWKKVVNAVHEEGGKIFMQLQHTGPLSQGNRFTDETIAPSSVKPKGEQLKFYLGEGEFKVPKEITKEEMNDIKKSFVEAAKRAKSVGFDGVELHGANGYLLDSFLTEYTNLRTDEYGGSTENRVRFLVEVATEVSKAVGDNFTVGMRISQSQVNDYFYKWSGKEEDAKIIFTSLGQSGLDYIHVTEFEAWQPAFDGMKESLVSLAKKYSHLPIIANGQLEKVERATEIISNGDADIVTLGKGALANHDWVNKVAKNEDLSDFNPDEVLHPIANIKDFEIN